MLARIRTSAAIGAKRTGASLKHARVTASRKTMATVAAEEASSSSAQGYPLAMKYMHWGMGGGILGAVGFVKMAQNTKDKKAKGNYMWYHKSFGLLAAGLLFPRIGLRFVSKVPALMPGPAWEHLAAKATHAAMYGFIAFMPISGVAMGYYGGKGLPFFWTKVPGASKENKNGKLAKTSYQWHKWVGQYGVYLIPLHVGAVGYHHLFKGQAILARMNPFV